MKRRTNRSEGGRGWAGLRAVACLVCVLVMAWAGRASGAELSAQVAVERTDVFVGESFRIEIRVSGSARPAAPALSGVSGFTVRGLGGRENSRRQMSIVNGQVTQRVDEGYVFVYELVAQRPGALMFPAVTVRAGGRTVRTQPVPIKARKPIETDELKLRLKLSKPSCYVGEPVTLSVVWYVGQEVQGGAFTLPILSDERLHAVAQPVDTSDQRTYYRLAVNGSETIGVKGKGRLDGRSYVTVTFQKVLIAKQAGMVNIEPATVTCEAVVGRRSANDMFGSFFGGSQAVCKKVVVPSNSLRLEVRDVPTQGRPPAFAGHVGEYRLDATASPTEVNVGDPVTLTIVLSGPEYLEHVVLPPLGEQTALARDFKIPAEMAPGKCDGRVKIFTQTIRALRPDVKAVPALELSYFDTRSGGYATAKTPPIPLKVRDVKVVTARDAEGRELPVAAGQQVQVWTQGIAHNYEDLSVLEDQRYGLEMWCRDPARLVLLGLPPLAYLFLLIGVVTVRRRQADPLATRARGAYGRLARALSKAGDGTAALDAWRLYLGDKLGLPAGAITFNDVRAELASRGARGETLEELADVFRRGEASRYAGTGAVAGDSGAGAAGAKRLARALERELQ